MTDYNEDHEDHLDPEYLKILKKMNDVHKTREGDAATIRKVLILAFPAVLPDVLLNIIYEYSDVALGAELTGIGSSMLPGNFTTPSNTKTIIKHMSSQKGSLALMMEWFLSISLENQENVIANLTPNQVITWFHIPVKRQKGVNEALGKTAPLQSYFDPRTTNEPEPSKKTKTARSKLEDFKSVISFGTEMRKDKVKMLDKLSAKPDPRKKEKLRQEMLAIILARVY